MASNRAVAITLATFAETFPTREVTEQTIEVWARVLANVPDDALERATLRLCRDSSRRFFPSSGEVFSAIAAEAKPVDVMQILHRIEKLGFYDATIGWAYPTNEQIREALGDEIADAYTVAGADKVYAPDERDGSSIKRDIARRKFSDRLDELQKKQPASVAQAALPAPKDEPLVPAIAAPRTPRHEKRAQHDTKNRNPRAPHEQKSETHTP